MSDNVENLILEHLRSIRGDIAGLGAKVDTLTLRVHSLEDHISIMGKSLANLHGDIMITHSRLDQVDARVERIERRLELTTA
jgi:septal ring factor EnvC (AmiA/AmiB activator)